MKQPKISKFGTAKPKNSFLFKFAIVHIPCVFCVCPNSSTATAASSADHKLCIVNTVGKVRHSFTSHVIVDKIIQNKNVNYDKTNESQIDWWFWELITIFNEKQDWPTCRVIMIYLPLWWVIITEISQK